MLDLKRTMVDGVTVVEKEWIAFRFLCLSKTKKTQIWQVTTKDDINILGQVRWFARWRQYSFFPEQATIFSSGCLRDIQNFMAILMEQKKGLEFKVGQARDGS